MRSARVRRRSGIRSRFIPRLDERGFGMILAIFFLSAAALAATVVVAVSASARSHQRWAIAKRSFTQMDSSIARFQRDVGEYPGDLSHLNRPVGTSDRDACNGRYSSTEVQGWKGPYLQQLVPSSGSVIGIGMILPGIDVVPGSRGAKLLSLNVAYVRLVDVQRMDAEIDGGDGRSSGRIQWRNENAFNGDLEYLIPTSGC
jgi:hypothetical protein